MHKSLAVNVFDVLGLRRCEDPHDRMLAWLCDPEAGHGLSRFASQIVESLWGTRLDESVRDVKRQYQLAPDSWPDVVVICEQSLVVIENKVNASALKVGQLERQHELALAQQDGKPLYHVLLCPDSFNVSGYGPDSPSFKVLPYSRLARVAREAICGMQCVDASVVIEQYAAYVLERFGRAAPPGIRIASAERVARRNTESQVWSEEEFLKSVSKHSSDIQQPQEELLDLLKAMECVEPRFDSSGPTNATYKVCLPEADAYLLLVYEDGRLYVQWGWLDVLCGQDTADAMKELWRGLVNPDNKDGGFVEGGLSGVGPEGVASRLQEFADIISDQA